jgi:hypothetical protein
MKWMEIIRLQSALGRELIAASEIQVLVSEIEKKLEWPGLKVARALIHAAIPGSFALSLYWDTDSVQPGGSVVGVRLSQSLKTLGLVDHSVWIETYRNNGGI